MAAAGIFADDERIELLDGWIIPTTPIGPDHSATVELLRELFQKAVPHGYCLRFQQTLLLPTSAPQPDAVVARGQTRDYRQRHPDAADAALVVEVADSSLAVDRGAKAALYAAAGIPEYWIIDLAARHVVINRSPDIAQARYQQQEIVQPPRQLPLILDGAERGQVDVGELFS